MVGQFHQPKPPEQRVTAVYGVAVFEGQDGKHWMPDEMAPIVAVLEPANARARRSFPWLRGERGIFETWYFIKRGRVVQESLFCSLCSSWHGRSWDDGTPEDIAERLRMHYDWYLREWTPEWTPVRTLMTGPASENATDEQAKPLATPGSLIRLEDALGMVVRLKDGRCALVTSTGGPGNHVQVRYPTGIESTQPKRDLAVVLEVPSTSR